MSVLARMGVPGLIIWLCVLASIGGTIVRGYIDAIHRQLAKWSHLFLFLGAIFVAIVINASFDVFIEGPMGGIWFWSLAGVTLAATWTMRRHPELM